MLSSIPQGITESRDTEPGKYLWQISTFEEKFQEGTGRLFFNTQLRCVMPASRLGRFHFESFWIGTEDDPNGDLPQTWLDSMGASQWKSFCKAAGVPFDGQDPKVIMANLAGKEIGGHVERVFNKKAQKHYTNVTKWYMPGTFEPVIDAPMMVESAPPVASPTVAPPATPRNVPQTPPVGQPPVIPPAPQQSYLPPGPQAAVQPQGITPGVQPSVVVPQVTQPVVPAVAPVVTQPIAESIPCAVCIGQGKIGADAAVLLTDMDKHVLMHANEQA